MTPEGMVNLTAVVSISFAFLEHQELTEQEARVLQFDQMITSARSVLRRCGRPPFLRSLWTLWWQLSQALHSMEQVLWPGQPPDAPLNLDLPVEPRPLSDLLLDEFDNAAPSVGPATRALEAFQLWFHQHYDATLHSELDQTLSDAALIFRTIEGMLMLKQRCRTLQLACAATSSPPSTDAPAAASSPAAFPINLRNPDGGEHLTWY